MPEDATKLLVHVRDYTKGHPSFESNNHPIRHGSVVGIHNGIIKNDDELFVRARESSGPAPEMTVDSEIIFALAERSRGRTATGASRSSTARWRRRGSTRAARSCCSPAAWAGRCGSAVRKHELFFASTRLALELVESYAGIKLRKSSSPEGRSSRSRTVAIVAQRRLPARTSPFEEEAAPGRSCTGRSTAPASSVLRRCTPSPRSSS